MADEPTSFDVLILGGGSGGYACALRAAELGLSVALVEEDKVGGTCLHRGCIPTKALLHAGEVADAVRESSQFGVSSTLRGRRPQGGQLLQGRRGRPASTRACRDWCPAARSPWSTATERSSAPHAVEVDGTRYEGRHVVLASGSYSRSLPGLEVDGERVLTSEHALELDTLPGKAVVLGGGVIGVEFASAWRSFGVDVTIIEALPRLVPGEDEACSKALERAFRKRGIAFKTGTPFRSVATTDSGVTVTVESGDTYDADLLLVAVGRGPRTADLGYEAQGIAMDRGFVLTDERLRTNVEGVYAVGDIVPGWQLAHRGFQQGIFVAEDIAGLTPAVIDEDGIPRVTYCDPEISSVGLSEAKAKERYGDDQVETLTYDLAGNGKSQILKTQGFVKLVRAKDGPVVGIHMVGARVGELIGEAQLIYNWEAFPSDVANLVHMHPTQGEALGEAHLALAGKPLHAHS